MQLRLLAGRGLRWTVYATTTLPSRREVLRRAGAGFGSLALAALLADEAAAAGLPANPLAPRVPHSRARARRVIFLFMPGGPSQVDTFDPKPRLSTRPRQARAQAIPGPDEKAAGLALEVPQGTVSRASR